MVSDKLAKLLEQVSLEDLLAEVQRREDVSFEEGGLLGALERQVETAKQQFGQSALQQSLDRLGPEDATAKACPRCGNKVRVRAKNRARTVKTLSGEITYRRNYHWCSDCKAGFYPRDIELGLSGQGTLSPELEKRVLDLGVNDSYGEAEDRWRLHYRHVPISADTIRRVVEELGRVIEDSHPAAVDEATLPSPTLPPETLVVSVDGGHVPIRGSEPWRECKLAVLVDGERYLRGTKKRRGMIGQARYVGVLGRQAEFRHRLDIALRMERSGKAKVIFLGDGAPGNWRLADALTPTAIEILDWYHAVEHAAQCAREVFGEQSPWIEIWVDSVSRALREGQVHRVLDELEACQFLTRRGRKALGDLRRYYESNQTRMRYDEYLRDGHPIGSGIVESAHRHVVQRRMKGAGQRWSLPAARRMVRLRCAYRTSGPKRFYTSLRRALELTRTGAIPQVGMTKRRASNRG